MKIFSSMLLAFLLWDFSAAAQQYPIVKGEVIWNPLSNKSCTRRSEGCFLQLKNGNILHLYSRFRTGFLDHNSADLAGIVISPDGQRIVHQEKVVIPGKKSGNVMSPSLLRQKDGRLMVIYLEKQRLAGSFVCRVTMRYSSDEGNTWTPGVYITSAPVYCIVLNGAALQLKSGRICIPVSQCRYRPKGNIDTCGIVYCLYSDDAGKTWKESASILFPPDRIFSRTGYQEPSAVELGSNKLLMYMRSDLGYLWKTVSTDGGNTWSKPEQDKNFPAVVAPPKIVYLHDKYLTVFYNQNPNTAKPLKNNRDRSVFAMKISLDEGKTWSKAKLIEPITQRYYSYPSVIRISGEAFLLSYYMQKNAADHFWHLKIKKILCADFK